MSSNSEIEEQQLVAYVDGELDPHDVAEVESALAEDPGLQKKISNYKKSAAILTNTFSTKDQKTPEHILSRIDTIEKRAETDRKPFFINYLYSYFQLRYAAPTFAAFAFGILLGPTLLGPSVNLEPSSDFSEGQIMTRGSMAESLQVQILQNGSTIANNGVIQASLPFSVTLLASLEGSATIREISDGVEGAVLDTQNSMEGSYLTFTAMQIDDQDSLSLRVALENSDMQIYYTLNFDVQN
jgi:hypothetical protein